MSSELDFVKRLLKTQLQLGDEVDSFDAASPLLGAIPKFDYTSIVAIISAIEEQLDISVGDDEISAELFTTVGTLADFITEKRNRDIRCRRPN